jgi:endogenous inhibitor of DNA gyrase (YacG/DUF329 family)
MPLALPVLIFGSNPERRYFARLAALFGARDAGRRAVLPLFLESGHFYNHPASRCSLAGQPHAVARGRFGDVQAMDQNPRPASGPQVSCPTCGARFTPEQSTAMPFCSVRCRQIDLGRWFNEEIGLPVDPDDENDNATEGLPN